MSALNYTITHIANDKLSVVWVKSQRPFNPAHAKSIADNFDPDLFEPVIVTLPNGAGIYHIIEGQHRTAGATQALGVGQRLPCHVIEDADPARAADIWLKINKTGRKPVRPITVFLVAVEAKQEPEVAINAIVKRCGYFVQNGRHDNCVTAVAALRRVYTYGPQTLQYCLEACRLIWEKDPNGVGSSILKGMGLFLNEFHSKVEARRLKTVIQHKYASPKKLVDAANAMKEKRSETLDVAMADLIRVLYNKGLPEAKKLKRRESE